MLSYEEAEQEIFKVLGEIKSSSEELRKLVEEGLKAERSNRKKEASE